MSPQTSSSSHNSSSFVPNGASAYSDLRDSNRPWEQVEAAPKGEYMEEDFDSVMASSVTSSSFDQGYGLTPSRVSSSAPSSSRSSINGAFFLSPTPSLVVSNTRPTNNLVVHLFTRRHVLLSNFQSHRKQPSLGNSTRTTISRPVSSWYG